MTCVCESGTCVNNLYLQFLWSWRGEVRHYCILWCVHFSWKGTSNGCAIILGK